MCKWLSGCLSLLVVLVCSGATQQQPEHTDRGMPVYIVSHGGWHTGIVIVARDTKPGLAFLGDHFVTVNWYEIGWGDKQFYQAGEVTTGLALRAGLLPTDSVLHVAALPEPPDAYFRKSRVLGLRIDAAGHERMVRAIAEYFQFDESGNPVISGKGLYGQSLFFDATGTFHAFNTCNTWTAEMLELAGLPVRSFMTLRANGVMRQLEGIAVSDTGER